MEIGKTYSVSLTVDESKLACSVGSGSVEVYATPMMIALIENCAAAAGIAPQAYVDNATLTAIDGRQLSFHVKAEDECGLIGEGEHQRVIVHTDKFNAKAKAKHA